MMKVFRAIPLFIICLLAANGTFAQIIKDPTTWTVEAKKKQGNEYEIVFRLLLKEGWHIWALKPGGDGLQVPPSFEFDKNTSLKLSGSVAEKGNPVTGLVDGVDGIVTYYQGSITYRQKATIAQNTKISGKYSYQVCDEQQCLAPKTVDFSVTVNDAGGAAIDTLAIAMPVDKAANLDSANNNPPTSVKDTTAIKPQGKPLSMPAPAETALLSLFLISLAGGIIAIFTPCIFSMIPITVSFFTKRSKTRKQGIRNAIYYSLSIIVIFTILGVLVSAIFGSAALNTLSTDWRANLFFFVLIVIFAISFLGAFEINLPSSWTSVTDSRAGVSSFMGIFFMALTLVIVSFSCTGPIVGTLLVEASKGGIAGPAVGMFGFSIGLALPFALFAVFPGMLNKMASSGGWLNQVKVVLGFVELMLALKFLSNADLAMGWRLLDREIFIALWIVLAIMLGIYLLGKLKLSHDDAPPKNIYGQEYVSIVKLFLAMVSFIFAIYLLPGMWGAPLNGMSAFLPPPGTFDSFGGVAGNAEHPNDIGGIKPVKYVKELKPNEPDVVKKIGLVTFFDYEEALAAAKTLKKPVMLDFTGINCVNCRKMEGQVWSDPEVGRRLKEDFIVASLYCDFNRIKLTEEQRYFSKILNMKVVTVGNRNSDLQATKFGSNSQPFYFFVDENGNKLIDTGYSYSPNIQRFIAHLDQVKENYKSRR